MNHHPDCHVTPTVKPSDEQALRRARTVHLAIDGLGCERCAVRVRNALLALDAVLRVDVDADTGAAVVAIDARRTDVPGLLAAVHGAGGDGRHRYRARLVALDAVNEVGRAPTP